MVADRLPQHPFDDRPPNKLPALDDPAVEGIDGAHSGVEAAAGADAADAAVLGVSAVVLLGASPGNCTAVCGLTDAGAPDALAEPACPDDVTPEDMPPPPADPAAMVDVATLRGSQPVDVEQADPETPVSAELVAAVLVCAAADGASIGADAADAELL